MISKDMDRGAHRAVGGGRAADGEGRALYEKPGLAPRQHSQCSRLAQLTRCAAARRLATSAH